MHAAELLHAHPDIVICRDEDARIMHVNPAFLKHFGGSKNDWFGEVMEPAALGAQIGAFYEDRMYGHLHSRAGSFWVEWMDVPLDDGTTMSCGRVNPDRRRLREEPPNGICRRKNRMVHETRHMPEIIPQAEAGFSGGDQQSVLSPADPLRKYLTREPAQPRRHAPAPKPPVAPAAMQAAPARVVAPAQALTRILLAEDDRLNAKLALALLQNEGCDVTHVEDGNAAVQAAKMGEFDMVFMDMRMPHMDGLEATRNIRKLGGKWLSIPIIALTANAFSSDREACQAAGMNGFITKPITVDGLLAAKRHWTNRQKQARTG